MYDIYSKINRDGAVMILTVGQEKSINPYVAGFDRTVFVAKMNALDMPLSRRINVTVPANQQCGEAS